MGRCRWIRFTNDCSDTVEHVVLIVLTVFNTLCSCIILDNFRISYFISVAEILKIEKGKDSHAIY